MRILDINTDLLLKDVALYLTKDEAKELRDTLTDLLVEGKTGNHAHINDLDYEHELTVLIYDEGNVDSLNERSKKIILQGI